MGPGELLDLFAQEAAEMVRELEQGLILLERSPRDATVLNRVFRAAHTIKGNAGIVGLETLAELTHAMETLLDAVRKGRVAADEPVISALLAGLDLVRGIVDDIRAPLPPERLELLRKVRAQIEAHASQAPRKDAEAATPEPGPPSPASPGVFDLSLRFGPDVMDGGHDPSLLIAELAEIGTMETVKADFGRMPDFRSMDVRRVHVSWQIRMTSPRGKKVIEDLFSFLPGGNRIEIREVARAPVSSQAVRPKEPPPKPAEPPRPAPPPRPPTPVAVPVVRPPEPPAPKAEPDFPVPPPQELTSRAPDFREIESPVLADPAAKSETVRVAVRVLDRLMTLAGEMVLTRNQLVQSVSRSAWTC
jgi:two-component system chemotaxis sensor kinase CheA